MTCPAKGQTIQTEDEIVRPVLVTESGKLAVYYVDTKTQKNCIVQNVETNKKWVLKNVANEMLITDSKGVFYEKMRKEVHIVDFNANKTDTIKEVTSIEIIEKLQTVVYFRKNQETLTVFNIKNDKNETLSNIKFYAIDKEDLQLLYLDNDKKLAVKNLNKQKKQVVVGFDFLPNQLKFVKWNHIDKTAYLFGIKNQELHLYSLKNKLLKIGTYPLENTKENLVIDTLFYNTMILPNDQLLIGVRPLVISNEKEVDVEIWKGSENGFTPLLGFLKKHQNQLAIIDLKDGGFNSLTKKDTFMGYTVDEVGGLYRYELLEHDDTSKLDPPITLYKYDFKTKKFNKFQTFSGNRSNFLSYKNFDNWLFFKENHWFYYDEKLSKEVGITESTKEAFYRDKHEYFKITGEESLSTPLEWKGKGFYLNDLKDVWYYDWKSNKISRVTNAKKDHKQYALCNCNHDLVSSSLKFAISTKPFDDLIITWTAGLNEFEGIDILKESGEQHNLAMDKAHFSQIKRFKNHIMFVKEKTNKPPALYMYDFKADRQKLIYQSNTWDSLSTKIVSEHFYWYNKNKESRGGIVRFPKNYKENDTIKYPVIVNIYEKKFHKQHLYLSPNILNSGTINFREYTQDDYFVIEPDIYYEIGEPGPSALRCITETLDTFSTVFPLDTDKMGIYGHSFGGYETNYVITQTPRFKAAVSSAGVADAVSMYFTYSEDVMRPDIFRFETQQWRMGKSFFDSPEGYIKNSPIYHAKNIETPLLLVTGNKDYAINWQQSLYMFSALKRLNKPVNLLIYNNESHNIESISNKLDVCTKTKQWFDYYLKGKERPKWM